MNLYTGIGTTPPIAFRTFMHYDDGSIPCKRLKRFTTYALASKALKTLLMMETDVE